MAKILQSLRYIQRYEPEQSELTLMLRKRDYDEYRVDPFGNNFERQIQEKQEQDAQNHFANRIGFLEEV